MAQKKDILKRFIFDKLPVRGEIVHLEDSWKAVLEKHEYPELVRETLGQAMAATVLLSATIKFLGSITLQIQGDGPVSLLVVQANTDKKVRAMASYSDEDLQPGLKQLFGEARLMITIEMDNNSERYQGIVELGETSIAQALEEYFRSSEQLRTRLWLAANQDMATGLLLQEMPRAAEQDPDDENEDWNRVVILAETLTEEELYTLSAEETLRRLYFEEDVRVFPPDEIAFSCSCSKERIEKTLKGLGYKEVKEILTEQGTVGVECNFCNHHYEFDAIDVERLFIESFSISSSKTVH